MAIVALASKVINFQPVIFLDLGNTVYCTGNPISSPVTPATMGLKQIDHGTREYDQMIPTQETDPAPNPWGSAFRKMNWSIEQHNILIGALMTTTKCWDAACYAPSITTLRLRQMAVQNNLREKASALRLMSFAENLARTKDIKDRHACAGHRHRLYEKLGYKVGDGFIEVNVPTM